MESIEKENVKMTGIPIIDDENSVAVRVVLEFYYPAVHSDYYIAIGCGLAVGLGQSANSSPLFQWGDELAI
ncbi:MAG: hypothetical protein P4L59_03265 [Desulfosporosinus sp.]|nr:hypothetical protein [Desulfosporosinus sp.]